jgi:hypothetical protein
LWLGGRDRAMIFKREVQYGERLTGRQAGELLFAQ